jgi:NDP-sugar pyrophosphorylase family protein
MAINRRNILSSIASAGFHDDYNNWHIAKHDVYGQQFKERWVDTGDVEHNNDHFEEIGQEDDVDDIIDDGSIDS